HGIADRPVENCRRQLALLEEVRGAGLHCRDVGTAVAHAGEEYHRPAVAEFRGLGEEVEPRPPADPVIDEADVETLRLDAGDAFLERRRPVQHMFRAFDILEQFRGEDVIVFVILDEQYADRWLAHYGVRGSARLRRPCRWAVPRSRTSISRGSLPAAPCRRRSPAW